MELFPREFLAGIGHVLILALCTPLHLAMMVLDWILSFTFLRRRVPPPRHVLITGASSGIGHGLAVEYAKRGARVVIITGRNEAALQRVVREIEAFGAKGVWCW